MIKNQKIKSIKKTQGKIVKLFSINNKNNNSIKEVYISEIGPLEIRGWKKQKKSSMHFIALKGKIKFVAFKKNLFKEKIINQNSLSKIFLEKNTWYAFKNLSINKSQVLSLMTKKYSVKNIDHKKLNLIKFNWKK